MGIIRPGPPTDLILKLKNFHDISKFVETGTYLGNTAVWAADNFSTVITIEWSEEIYNQTVAEYGTRENIKFLQGNSVVILQQIIPTLTQPSVFWLDAHWSSGQTAGESLECPLLDEIIEINKSDYTHFIFIDDARMFTSPPPLPHSIEQWPTIDQVIGTLKNSNHNYYIVIIDDVIVAVPEYAKAIVAGYCQQLNTHSAKAGDDIRTIKNTNLFSSANSKFQYTATEKLAGLRRTISHLQKRWINPLIDLGRIWTGVRNYRWYISSWREYDRRSDGEQRLRFLDSAPHLFDRTETTPYDSHYFYQDIWAFGLIQASNMQKHFDIGSRAILVGMLSSIIEIVFVDIRPLVVNLDHLNSFSASILSLPFPDNSISSLSCLHVAEHIGLGRYGDPLDPVGTKKAARELARVLAPGGNLYFSLPVGYPRVCFNAHRIHAPQQIIDYFFDLELVQFSGVDDKGVFRQGITPDEFDSETYGCGMFYFTKK